MALFFFTVFGGFMGHNFSLFFTFVGLKCSSLPESTTFLPYPTCLFMEFHHGFVSCSAYEQKKNIPALSSYPSKGNGITASYVLSVPTVSDGPGSGALLGHRASDPVLLVVSEGSDTQAMAYFPCEHSPPQKHFVPVKRHLISSTPVLRGGAFSIFKINKTIFFFQIDQPMPENINSSGEHCSYKVKLLH